MRQARPYVAAVLLVAGCSFDGSAALSEGRGDPGQADGGPGAADSGTGADAAVERAFQAYWSFDTDASDAKGDHHGTMMGGASITTGGSGFGGGEALSLAANGDRVDVGNPTGFDFNADFTWHIRFKSAEGSGALFSRNPLSTAWNQGSKALFVRNDRVQWDTGWVGNPSTGVVVDDDEWHQVIAIFVAETNALDIFVDPAAGETSGDYSSSHEVDRFDEHSHVHLSGLAETGFSIGQANFSGGLSDLNTLVGLIDEVAIFDRALSGTELDQLITQGPASF